MGLCLYFHWPRWLWTNLAPLPTSTTTFFAMPPSFDQKVDHILDPNRTSLPIIRDDLLSLALVNNVGAPRRAFSTFMIFLLSFAFHNRGLVWCGMLTLKSIVNPLLMNRSVLWDFKLEPQQLLAFQRLITVCIGPNHGSYHHGVVCWFMHCIAKASWWPNILSKGRGFWSRGTAIHIHGGGNWNDGCKSQSKLSIWEQMMEEFWAQRVYAALSSKFGRNEIQRYSHNWFHLILRLRWWLHHHMLVRTKIKGVVNAPSSQ